MAPQMEPRTRRPHRCPRCGRRLTIDDVSGIRLSIRKALSLRGWHCSPACGWHGLRFSRSLRRASRRRKRIAWIVLMLVLTAAMGIRFILSRAQEVPRPDSEDLAETQ